MNTKSEATFSEAGYVVAEKEAPKKKVHRHQSQDDNRSTKVTKIVTFQWVRDEILHR